MIVKIVRSNVKEDSDLLVYTDYFEADRIRYSQLKKSVMTPVCPDALYLYDVGYDVGVESHTEDYNAELWLTKDDRRIQIFLKGVDVFIMNDQGQTVDRIYA